MNTQKRVKASALAAVTALSSIAEVAFAEESTLFGIQLLSNYQDYTIDHSTMKEDGYGLDPYYRVDVLPPERNPGFEYYTVTFDKKTSKIHEVQAEHEFGNEQSCQEAADDLSQLLRPKFGKEPEKHEGVYGQSRQYEYLYPFDAWAASVRCITFSGFETWLYIGIETDQLWETRVKNFEKF